MSGTTAARVVMIDSELAWRGGQTQVELLLRGLDRQRFELALAAPPGSRIAGRAASLGVEFFSLPINGDADVASAWRLRRLLKKKRFDIVHSHSAHAHGISYLATRRMNPRPRLVVSRRVGFAVAKNFFSRLKYKYGADLFLAISSGVKDALLSSGVPEEKIMLVPSGVDIDRLKSTGDRSRLIREFSLEEDALLVGTVGALTANKAHKDFIRAALRVSGEFPRARFLIVGDGELLQPLQSLSKQAGMQEKIIFTGFRNDVPEILSVLHCFVISSVLEGLCTSIIDAQVLEIPVVATDTGGIPDLVQDGITGLLVPPGCPEELAGAVIRMLKDPGLRSKCTSNGKIQAVKYHFSNMVQQTAAGYGRVLAGRVSSFEAG